MNEVKYNMKIWMWLLLMFLLNVRSEIMLTYKFWKCINGACVRNEFFNRIPSQKESWITFNECQLTCNHFARIYPKPNGEVQFSDELEPIHPNRVSFEIKMITEDNKIAVKNGYLSEKLREFVNKMESLCSKKCLDIFSTKMLIRIYTSECSFTEDTNYSLQISTKGGVKTVSIRSISLTGAEQALLILSQLMMNVSLNQSTTILVLMKQAFVRNRYIFHA